MGERGPMPTPNRQRSGRNPQRENHEVQAGEKIAVPPADSAWGPMATDWYESLAISAQASYYEASDWQFAKIVATDLSEYYKMDPPLRSAAKFKAIIQGMEKLLVTHGARMRAHIEVLRDGSNEEKATRQQRAARQADLRREAEGDNG